MKKILHLSFHKGTMTDIRNLINNLEMKIQLDEKEMNQKYLYMNTINADQLWQENKHIYQTYDTIVITDTAMLARPFFQHMNEHSLHIILYITNRFDWLSDHEGTKEEYIKLYKNISLTYRDRCSFITDNLYDQYYASLFNIKMQLVRHYMKESLSKEPLPVESNMNKLFIYDRGTRINTYVNHLSGIEYDVYNGDYKPYRNCDHIREYKCYLHLPYQVNIISLWENLSFGIIYFLPSKQLLKKWVGENWYYWEEKSKPKDILEKSIDFSEWYQPQFSNFFLFFDSWEDLHTKLSLDFSSFIKKEIEKKRTYINTYIPIHNNKIVTQWHSFL